jgi:glutamate-1-semialdehyde 2,1-aminomutase
VFIMDEVVNGFRWAPGGVQEVEGLKPDLTTLAKILAGGFPGGAVAGKREVMEHLQFGSKGAKIGHPGTFNANPLSAVAGTTALREIADGKHQKRANELSAQLRAGMNGVMCEMGLPGFVYGQASEFRIVIAGTQVPESQDYDPRDLPWSLLEQGMKGETTRVLQLAMTNHGAHLFGGGGLVSSVHSEEDIARTVDAWRESLKEMREERLV